MSSCVVTPLFLHTHNKAFLLGLQVLFNFCGKFGTNPLPIQPLHNTPRGIPGPATSTGSTKDNRSIKPVTAAAILRHGWKKPPKTR
jgi:hypothetical protein